MLSELRVEIRYLRESVAKIERTIEDTTSKIAALQHSADMGHGAWMALLKLGSVILGITSGASGLIIGAAAVWRDFLHN